MGCFIHVLIAALCLVAASGGWAQSLGGACSGAAITSPVQDGGLLRCNGSTYVGAGLYANSFIAGTSSDGLGHLQVLPGDTAHTGYLEFVHPTTGNIGYLGYSSSAGLNLVTQGAYPLNFYTSNSIAMTILPSGNVGIGTMNPQSLLNIVSNNTGNLGALFDLDNSASNGDTTYSMITSGRRWYMGVNPADSNNKFKIAMTSGNPSWSTDTLLTLANTGNLTIVGTLTQSSDARLKTNIEELAPDVFEKLALIKGVTFNWKGENHDLRQQVGVIAQDVQKAYPQLVSADASGTLSVNYSGLVAPLIEAVKQLKTENIKLQHEADADRHRADADHKQAQLDHDLLFKIRQHIALTNYQETPYTESAWQYAPPPKGWEPPVPATPR